MEFWVSCLLFFVCAAGVILLCRKMRKRERKLGRALGIAGLSVIGIVSICYAALALFFLGSIK